MKTLEQRIQTIEDRNAILELEATYAVAWDFGRARQWAEVFTEEGVFEMLASANTPRFTAIGQVELQGFCETISRHWTGLHFMHPPHLRIGENDAESIIFFEFRHVMRGDGGDVRQGNTIGKYHTTYRRTEQGWRMAKRVESAVFESISNAYPLLGLEELPGD